MKAAGTYNKIVALGRRMLELDLHVVVDLLDRRDGVIEDRWFSPAERLS
jgi:hypothetical protein